MKKIPCATCKDMCDQALNVYGLHDTIKELGLKEARARFICPKTNKEFILDLRRRK